MERERVTKGLSVVSDMGLDPRIHVFRAFFRAPGEYEGIEVDAYVVVTERYVIVCDTLLCPEDMETVMYAMRAELVGRQLLVINSHADWDHSWGNSYFIGEYAAPIIAHEYCRMRMLSEEAQAGINEYRQRFNIFDSVVLMPPTLTFKEQFTIHGGDLTLELLAAPGHHPDHIAVWIPELRLLLAFDAAEKPLPLIESKEGVQSMLSTLARFLSMQPHTVLCSHGKTTSISTIQENLAYLREIERRSRVLLKAGHPSPEKLERAALLINYPLDEVLTGASQPVEREFYAGAHNKNVRNIIEWLMD